MGCPLPTETHPTVAVHPAVAGSIVRALETNVEVPFVREVQRCMDTLVEADFAVPLWEELADGVRPPPSHDEEEPNQYKHGWQKVAGHYLDRKLQVVTSTLSACYQALLRSQPGPLAEVPFVCFPTSRLTRLDPPVFRTLLLRRLRLPFHLTVRACRCGLFPMPLAIIGRSEAARILPRSRCEGDGECVCEGS